MSSTGPRLRYRTAADVRAIPNEQWESWARGDEPFPGVAFSADRWAQRTLREILSATERRLNTRLGRPRRKRSNG
jgi:hypothetical protein